jgi:pimeloyl-ACP methyl ester carboxylesterase
MPYAQAPGARIYFEETGRGAPILFIHEFAGDYRSWEGQVRHLSRGWRCLTFSARGYPPSDCPGDERLYSQEIATRDVIAVLDAAGIDKAHLVGLSMGAYTGLMCAVHFPGRVLSVVAGGGGSGAARATREAFVAEARARADDMEKAGKIDVDAMGHGPTRVQLLDKDIRGWRDFVAQLAEHPAAASARVLRGIQATRPSLYDCEAQLRSTTAPILLMVGDEDEPCLDVNLWMKRLLPNAQLVTFPGSGHAINLEEPGLFNHLTERFITAVDRGAWRPRDPRAAGGGVFTSLGGGARKA